MKASRRRLIGTLAVGITASTVSVFALASPAAANRDGACNYTDVCVREHRNYEGGVMDYSKNDDNFQDERFFGTHNSVNDAISSVINYDSYCSVNFYRNAKYNTFIYGLTVGGEYYDLKVQTMSGNDEASSLDWRC
jgi:hypothetical protein